MGSRAEAFQVFVKKPRGFMPVSKYRQKNSLMVCERGHKAPRRAFQNLTHLRQRPRSMPASQLMTVMGEVVFSVGVDIKNRWPSSETQRFVLGLTVP
jgi:hypothetical protein